MTATLIEWTDVTWNPVRGCARVSPGCEHCYAERQAARFCAPTQPFEGLVSVRSHASGLRYTDPRAAGDWTEPRWTGEARFIPKKLSDPLSWSQPRRVFVNSMSDLFHDDITDEQIAAVFGVMAMCRQHTFQILTKRAPRMRDWFGWMDAEGFDAGKCALEASNLGVDIKWRDAGYTWPLPNVWLGVSCEDQARADARIPFLLATPAALRFVSAEPLLDSLELERFLEGECWGDCDCDSLYGYEPGCRRNGGDGHLTRRIDWVIVGGESGYEARPCFVDHTRSVVQQCKAAHVPVFVKQLGKHPAVTPPPYVDGDLVGVLWGVRHKKGGNMDEWPEDLRVRQFPFEESAP